MKNKVNIQEGIESLERILLMMNYDNKKTLSENKVLLNEQISDTEKKDIISKYFKGNKNFEKLFSLRNTTNEKLNFESSFEGEGPTIFYSPVGSKVYRFFLLQVEKSGKNTINFQGPNGSGVATIDTTNNSLNLKYNNKAPSESLKFYSNIIDKSLPQNKEGYVSPEEITQLEKIYGEKIPYNQKNGLGVNEWQNKLAYNLLKELETTKRNKGWEFSQKSTKYCLPEKFVVTNTLKEDIKNKILCMSFYGSKNNPSIPYNSNVDYHLVLLNEIMSIQEANYENLKGKILELYKTIPNETEAPKSSYIYDSFKFPTSLKTGQMSDEDKKLLHNVLMVGQIVTPFFGPIGMGVGAALGMYDASLYLQEDDLTSATLALIFAALDLGWLYAELKLTKLGAEEAKKIIQAVKNNQVDQLSPQSQQLLKDIVKNTPEITEKIGKKMVQEVGQDAAKLNIINKAIIDSKKASMALPMATSLGGAFGGVYAGEKIIKSGSPKDVVENTVCGEEVIFDKKTTIYCNWEITKKIFGSDGSEKDNSKLRDAIQKGGWIPYKQEKVNGEITPNPIPKEYKTKTKKEEEVKFAEPIIKQLETVDEKDLKKIQQALISPVDWNNPASIDSLYNADLKILGIE